MSRMIDIEMKMEKEVVNINSMVVNTVINAQEYHSNYSVSI